MSTVLQSEVRLHEGILAGLTLQRAYEEHAQQIAEIGTAMELAILKFKDALDSDHPNHLLREKLLPLLFNLQELIASTKASQIIARKRQYSLCVSDEVESALHQRLADAFTKAIDWMEDVAETWSMSLDESYTADIESRVDIQKRPVTQLRDWREVLREVAHDAEVQD